jgi:aconitate hydratase
MGELAPGRKLEETIAACVTGRFGDKITTDHIAPGGVRLKLRSNIAAYAEFVFEKADPDFVSRAKACVEGGRKNVIVAGLSYGQGSSREHAALCPAYLGVCAVIAKSFERIHSANLVNFGIMPLTFRNEADYDGLDAGKEIEFVEVVASLRSGGDIRARVAGGGELSLSYDLSARQRDILLAGGMLSYLREKSS